MSRITIEVTTKSITYMNDYDRYAVEVIFPYEYPPAAKLEPIHPLTDLPDDVQHYIEALMQLVKPSPKAAPVLSGYIYLTEEDYTNLGRFGVGAKLELKVGTGNGGE